MKRETFKDKGNVYAVETGKEVKKGLYLEISTDNLLKLIDVKNGLDAEKDFIFSEDKEIPKRVFKYEKPLPVLKIKNKNRISSINGKTLNEYGFNELESILNREVKFRLPHKKSSKSENVFIAHFRVKLNYDDFFILGNSYEELNFINELKKVVFKDLNVECNNKMKLLVECPIEKLDDFNNIKKEIRNYSNEDRLYSIDVIENFINNLTPITTKWEVEI